MQSTIRYLRAVCALAAIAAFGLRSLIPAGYMPDFASPHALFALTVCDGMEHDMSSMPGHAGHMHHGSHSGTSVCPFSVGAVYGLAGIAAPVIDAPVFALTTAAPRRAELAEHEANFSNASPRSPPPFS